MVGSARLRSIGNVPGWPAPGQFRVYVQGKVTGAAEQFAGRETIAAHEKIRLVQPMLAQQWRCGERHAFRLCGMGLNAE